MRLEILNIAGRADGFLIITRKENLYIKASQKCVVIDLLSCTLSDCVTIQQIEHVYPFQYTSSETEQGILLEFIQELVSDQTLKQLIDRLTTECYSN